MKVIKTIIIFLLFPFSMIGQEVVKKTNFPSRDFYISQDSIYFIEKRDVHIIDKTSNNETDYFIGGYGLELFVDEINNEIITASNELVRNASSIWFYNKSTQKVGNVFNYRKGRIIDFLIIPELNMFVLSLTNKKIIFIDFKERPTFRKAIEIKLDALSRKLIYKNNKLYYATDLGQIFQYDLSRNTQKLLYKENNTITDFYLESNIILYATINGQIVKVDLLTSNIEELNIGDDFIINSLYNERNKLICGSWKGLIYVVDVLNFRIVNELKYHKRTVLKITNYKDNIFYSSSLDNTIKKWILN
jgi:WD40 repeat protein